MPRSLRRFVWVLVAFAWAVSVPNIFLCADDAADARKSVAAAQSSPPQQAAQDAKGKNSAKEKPLNPRVLFITSKDSPKSEQELTRLSKTGGDFDKLRAQGWKIGDG